MNSETEARRWNSRQAILAVVVVAAIAAGSWLLHRRWTDKTAEDIESFATLALAALTVVLAYFNYRLADMTSKSLTLAREQFGLSQAQFESEWRPDLRIVGIMAEATQVRIELANVSRCVALVKEIKFGIRDIGPQWSPLHGVERYGVTLLADAGVTAKLQIHTEIGIYKAAQDANANQLSLAISVIYDCGGRSDLFTPWSDFTVTFVRGGINSVALR